jgi:hypothetical protein
MDNPRNADVIGYRFEPKDKKNPGGTFDIRPTFDIKLEETGFLEIEQSFEKDVDDFFTRMETLERGFQAIAVVLPGSSTITGFIIPEGIYFVSNIYNDQVPCFVSELMKRCTLRLGGRRKTHRVTKRGRNHRRSSRRKHRRRTMG